MPSVIFGDTLAKVSLRAFNNDLYQLIQEFYADLVVECYEFNGTVLDGIQKMIQKDDLDYIVMGITGVNKIKEVLIGSNIIAIIKAINKPILVIPKVATLKKI